MTLCIPQISISNLFPFSNGPIAFKLYTEVRYLKLHTKIVIDYCKTRNVGGYVIIGGFEISQFGEDLIWR